MKKIPLLLPFLALVFSGCAHHEDKSTNPYVEWERKRDRDEDHDFFYKGWLNPNDNEFEHEPPIGIAGPPN